MIDGPEIFFPVLLLMAVTCGAAEISVGSGKDFSKIEEALIAAQAGDTIMVHPLPESRAYSKVALYITQPDITIKGVGSSGRVSLRGDGFEYSGRGSTPRAIVQFNKGADRCRLEGFTLSEAHNNSHNGAGVRINQANGISIVNCEIHSNDMGIMSNGDGTSNAGAHQRIESCLIHHNGSLKEPGYNHNLYLGGESATIKGCEIHSSLTGHNVKSRSHRTVIHACYIHDSSNREVDLVDHKGDTSRSYSDAVIINCIIVKDNKCRGNRGVIHFGQDIGGDHNGTLHLINNTIVTPFISPVVYLSANRGDTRIYNNIICDGGAEQRNQVIAQHSKKVLKPKAVFISNNWFSHGYPDSTTSRGTVPPFSDASNGDYALNNGEEEFADKGMDLPAGVLHIIGGKYLEYRHPLHVEERSDKSPVDLGAYGF